ncbi:MAG: ABC transporter permease [Candidatus Aminicenantes bacterium]|nr:ABC transporter permease [Candidatus Aminicenantes bacterium]
MYRSRRKLKPPRLAAWILDRILPDGKWQTPLGDFEEYFYLFAGKKGIHKARLWYWSQILRLLPAKLINSIYWSIQMFKNYLKVAIRNINRNKGFSFINITGLTIGITICFLILLYVLHEITYDRHLPNAENTYRVCTKVEVEGNKFNAGQAVGPLAPALRENFPEIRHAGRLYIIFPFLAYENKTFYEDNVYYADPDIIDIFAIEFLRGNPETALEAPYSVILTAETAKKYFGRQDPLGKMVRWNDRDNYTVTGVVKKLPDNTHIKFNVLASFSTVYKLRISGPPPDRWIGFNYKTYITLREDASSEELEAKFPALLAAHVDEIAKQMGLKSEIYLQPITRIHLFTHLYDEDSGNNLIYVIVFSAIALFIFLIACVNFMNLSTARSSQRSREVGMRKVLGANKGKLIRQFLGEAILLSLIGLFLALLFVLLLLPAFSHLIAKDLEFNPIKDWELSLGFLVITFIVGLLAGSYPAFFLSSIQPASSLKGIVKAGQGARRFRNSLVNVQFVISIALICCTVIIFAQLRFVKNRNLGFNQEQLMVITLRGSQIRRNHDVFKNSIKKIPGVIKAAGSSYFPTRGTNETNVLVEGQSEEKPMACPVSQIDHDFLTTLQIELIEGRNFAEEFTSDSNSVIVNQSLVKESNWENPIGKTLQILEPDKGKLEYKTYTVIGLVKNFHFTSLHEKIRPHVMCIPGDISYISVRLAPGETQKAINAIETEWKKIEDSRPMTFNFVDDMFDNLYRSEQRLGWLFIYFSGLAVFIACLGLFGLSSFTVEQKTKEIGIRKVLGAPVSGMVLMLVRQFGLWLVISSLVAWPLAYFAMHSWLQNYAYRVEINVLVFLLSSLIAAVVAFLTVSYQSVKAALANPVDSLRYE